MSGEELVFRKTLLENVQFFYSKMCFRKKALIIIIIKQIQKNYFKFVRMSKRNFPFNVNIDSYMDLNDSRPQSFSPYREKQSFYQKEQEIKEPLRKAVNNQKSNQIIL